MSNGSELKSRAAMALRAAGYKPLPRWWVTQEQLDLIAYMAKQNQRDVNEIRRMANSVGDDDDEKKRKRLEIELAWRAKT